jgi:hypothetical protein
MTIFALARDGYIDSLRYAACNVFISDKPKGTVIGDRIWERQAVVRMPHLLSGCSVIYMWRHTTIQASSGCFLSTSPT